MNGRGEITLSNERGCEILGYEHHEIIGKNWFETFLPPDIVPEVKKVFQTLMRGEVELVEYYENQIRVKSGEYRDIAFHNTILKDDDGNIAGVL